MVKKLVIGIFFVSFLPFLRADEATEQIIGPFGTLNNRDNSATIPSNYAQDLLNVDITPGGKSFKKRRGTALSYSLTITTSPVHGIYEFFDANGNNIELSFNDAYGISVVNGGTPAVLFSTGPNGATYQCTDSQGFAYCSDSARSNVLKTNGVTYSLVPVTSTGTMVAVTPDRLVFSGFGTTAPNRIDFSASGDFTNYTVSVLPTSPFSFTITSPGSKVTHITYAFNRIMWFKDSSFGYILAGNTASDWQVKTISPNVGTLDNSSVYWQDVLYFRGQDSHIYSYNGSNLVRLSREISGTIALAQNRSSNSWSQTTSPDFFTGSLNPSVYTDTNTYPDSIQLTYPDFFTTLRTAKVQGLIGKVAWSTGAYNASSSSVSISNSRLVMTAGTNVSEASILTATIPTTDFRPGTTFHFTIPFISTNSITTGIFRITLSSTPYISGDPLNTSVAFAGDWWNFTFGGQNGSTSANLTSIANSNGYSLVNSSLSITLPINFDIYITTSNLYYTLQNSSTTGPIAVPAGFALNSRNIYTTLFFRNSTGLSQSMALSNYGVFPETFSYLSAVKNAPNLTSWDTLSVTSQNNGGSHTFYLRASTNSFLVSSSTPAWSQVTSGNIPSISTGTYFQFRDDIALSSASSISPKFDDFTQNWFEGLATDKSYATYFNDSIWFSVAYGAGATTNNRILKYDLLNQGWIIYDIPSNGFYIKNLSLYIGSPATGNIYKFGDVDSDINGSAINAYWKSKDFIGTDPFKNDELRNISIYGFAVANSSLTVTYTLNESTFTSYTLPTYRGGATFFQSNRNLPLGITTNAFNIKVGNNAANQYFEIMAERVGINEKPWATTNP